MKEKIVHNQYNDNKSILVVFATGKIIRVFVPFKVICIEITGDIKLGNLMYVEEILSNEKDQLIYFIKGRYYFYFYFKVAIVN